MAMGDLLIRGIPDELKRQLQELANRNRRNLSDEAKIQLRKGIANMNALEVKAGDHLASLLDDGYFSDEEIRHIEQSRKEPDRSPPELR
jgi:plasmid stability protein